MSTLKEIRTAFGMTQTEVAKIINMQQSNYNGYENGTSLPCLEDCVLLEKKFQQRIDWESPLSLQEGVEIMEGMINLCKYYPVPIVLTFAQKALRDGIRLGQPSILVKNYASMAARIVDDDIPPMAPTGIKFREEED
jgi:transcriptional regulator with XRE-family HTH domain